MEEAITEDTADVEKIPEANELEAKESLEGIIGEGEHAESMSIDRETHEVVLDKNRYTKTSRSLNNRLKSDEDISFTIDEEGKITPTYKGRRVYSDGCSMPDKLVGKQTDESKTGDAYDSFDGAHVIIYHRDPETGKFYFSLEIKTADHPQYPHKASLFGGSIKIGEIPTDGAVRELKEELPDSYKIIIKALNETRYKVGEITSNIGGVVSTTYIWAAEIKDPSEWSKHQSSRSTEGYNATISLEKMICMIDNEFAYGFGPITRGFGVFIQKNYGKIPCYNSSYNFYSKKTFSSTILQNLN